MEVNLAGAALLGLDRRVASQMRFGQFVAMEHRGAFADFLEVILATDDKQTREVRLERDGSSVWVLVEAIAAQDHQIGTLPRDDTPLLRLLERCVCSVNGITPQCLLHR